MDGGSPKDMKPKPRGRYGVKNQTDASVLYAL